MVSVHTPTQPLARKRSGLGCLGCLGQVSLVLLLAGLGFMALIWVLFPWAYYMGGSFHILPYWQGLGKLHAKSGDYVLYVRFQPTTGGSRMFPASNLTGIAYLCSPRGERFRMNLGGGMRAHLNRSTDGEAITLYMHYWPWNAQFVAEHRPRIDFRGHWQNPNIVGDDHGSISNAFTGDGSVYRGGDRNHPYSSEVVPLTLVAGSYSDFDSACANIRH